MTPIKQEHTPGPSTPSSLLGARIAKYAYTSPAKTPVRTPTKPSPIVKVEAGGSDGLVNGRSGQVGRASPYFSPIIKTDGDVKDGRHGVEEEEEDCLVPGPTAGPSRSTGERTRHVSSNGLETPEGDLPEIQDVQDVPLRRSKRTISQMVSLEPLSDEIHQITSSDSDPGSESDLSEPPPPISEIRQEIPQKRQTRILPSRASRDQRVLVESRSGSRARSRVRAIEREDTSSEDEDEDGDIPPAPVISTPRSRNRNGRTRPRGYAGPEMYQHMRPLPDILAPDLDGTSLLQGSRDTVRS